MKDFSSIESDAYFDGYKSKCELMILQKYMAYNSAIVASNDIRRNGLS